VNQQILLIEFSIPTWVISPFGYLLVILLGIEFLMPRLWNVIEYVWWRVALGNSSLSHELRRAAKRDFYFLIERQIEHGTPRSLAVLLTIPRRMVQLPRLSTTFRRRKAEMCPERFESMIEELNRLWRQGSKPQYLNDYVREIEKLAYDRSIDPELRLLGLCAVSVIKYALGSIAAGNALGRRNWRTAQQLESDLESVLKWLASYGFFNSTLFLGQCNRAINLMSTQWSRYYVPLHEDETKSLREQLFGKLILNPILAIPRHIILAFALAEILPLQKQHWPTEAAFRNVNPKDQYLKLKWFDSWSAVAEDICAVEPISLSFTRAYGSFFLTLMLLEKNVPAPNLHSRINEALACVDTSSAIVAQYASFGMRGVYRLVCGENESAFDDLSNAASFSAISGNRFADCIFTCSLAVAAARLNRSNRYLVPQIKRHMAQARQLADTLKSDLFTSLCDAAESAICLQFGNNVKAEQYAARSRAARPESLLLRIFDVDALEPHKPFSAQLRLTA
jgi:hypothetical protein